MLTRLFRYWFTFTDSVGPRQYLTHGAALMTVKYASDAALVWLAISRLWSPVAYMQSLSALQSSTLADAPSWLMPVLACWTLPFLWAGVTLSMRRAIDAGFTPWVALGFFVPYVNYITIAMLSTLPTRAEQLAITNEAPTRSDQIKYLGVMLPGVTLGLLMIGIAVYAKRSYGAALFFATPFGVGALTAFLLNRRFLVSRRQTIQVVLLTTAVLAAALILTGVEGGLCIAMAVPLAMVASVLGAIAGHQIASETGGSLRPAALGMIALPLAAIVEPHGASGVVLHEVRSSVEIAASPLTVWSQVVAFPPMEEPRELFFRLGIAYPNYARIEGSGVGAVRYCVFSTGPFVEPITVWEPGKRLAFDVRSAPVPMRELSPFDHVLPPHLSGFLQSRRGEFRLIGLPNGHTRLEGSTWYTLAMGPEGYWQLYGDYLIHRIHLRVLDHIKVEAERAPPIAAGSLTSAR